MPTEQERIDALTQDIEEIGRTAEEHLEANGGDASTLDMDVLADALMARVDERITALNAQQQETVDHLEQMVEQRLEEALDATPRRTFQDGPTFPPPGHKDAPSNKYEEMLKYSAVKPGDLWLAHKFLSDLTAMRVGGVSAPSEALSATVQKLMGGTGIGAELVPDGLATDIWQDFFLESRVLGLMKPVMMPSDGFTLPTIGTAEWRKGASGQATGSTDITTGGPTLTVTKLMAEVDWPYELAEDAVVAMMPLVRGELSRSGAEQMDGFALNADGTQAATGNINLDDAMPSSDVYYLSNGQDGIRHQYLVDNAHATTGQIVNAGGDALTDTDMEDMLAKMGKYGIDPLSSVIVTDPRTYLRMRGLDDVKTLDKYGDRATVLTGELGNYMGVPLVISASHPLAEADGKVSATAANNTLGGVSAFNRNMWAQGFLRQLMIEAAKDIRGQVHFMVASFRVAVVCWGTRATATHTAGIRNILV